MEPGHGLTKVSAGCNIARGDNGQAPQGHAQPALREWLQAHAQPDLLTFRSDGARPSRVCELDVDLFHPDVRTSTSFASSTR